MKGLFSVKSVRKILGIAIPALAATLLTFMAELINIIFIGHVGTEYMIAGVGLGNMCVNILWLAIYLGMNGALETLVSQASASHENMAISGHYLNRGRIVIAISFIPSLIILCFAEKILVAIHIHPMVAHNTQKYLYFVLPGLFC